MIDFYYFGILMTHLRMSTSAVLDRAGPSDNLHGRGFLLGYLFTQSQWHAISYVSRLGAEINDPSVSVIEGGYVDPWEVFPGYVMRQVDYAIKFGVACHVTEYEFADVLMAGSIRAGCIIELYDERVANTHDELKRSLGFYAVRYPRQG